MIRVEHYLTCTRFSLILFLLWLSPKTNFLHWLWKTCLANFSKTKMLYTKEKFPELQVSFKHDNETQGSTINFLDTRLKTFLNWNGHPKCFKLKWFTPIVWFLYFCNSKRIKVLRVGYALLSKQPFPHFTNKFNCAGWKLTCQHSLWCKHSYSCRADVHRLCKGSKTVCPFHGRQHHVAGLKQRKRIAKTSACGQKLSHQSGYVAAGRPLPSVIGLATLENLFSSEWYLPKVLRGWSTFWMQRGFPSPKFYFVKR